MVDSAPQRPEGGGQPGWDGGQPGWDGGQPAGSGAPAWSSPVPAPNGWGGPVGLPPGRRPGDRRSVVPLRPLGVGELLDGALGVVRSYPRPVFAVGAAVALVGAVLQLLVVLTLLRPLLRDAQNVGSDLNMSAGTVAGAGIGGALALLFSTFATLLLAGLVSPAVSRGLLGRPLSAREAWEQLRPRLAPLVGVSALVTLTVFAVPAVAVGLTVLLVAGAGGGAALAGILLVPTGFAVSVLLYVRWAFAPLCAVLEKQGVRQSLQRSALLVRRSWWRVLGVLALAALVGAVVSQILQLPFSFVGGESPGQVLSGSDTTSSVFVVSAIGSAVAATVVGPFAAAVRGLLYADRRMRAEGLDVALSAAVAAPLTAPGGP